MFNNDKTINRSSIDKDKPRLTKLINDNRLSYEINITT